MKKTASAGQIFLAFLRLGLTAFGGPAMVAYIRQLVVDDKGWLSKGTFQKGVALCQTIPGATAMQAAAYAGLRAGGPAGAVSAYVAFGLPAFLLMVLLSALYVEGQELPAVISLFSGLQLIVIALMANATLGFGRSYVKAWRDLLPVALSSLLTLIGSSPVVVIILAGCLGVILYKAQYGQVSPGQANKPARGWHHVQAPLLLALLFGLLLLFLFVVERQLFWLALLLVKIDLFAFGGGYTSVPLLFHEIVEVRHWLSQQMLIDGIAMGQLTPGPIVITATFVGYLLSGLPGAVVGTLTIFTPSLFILLLVVPYFDRLQHTPVVQRVLRGILLSFVGLLFAVTLRFGLAVHWSAAGLLLFGLAFVALHSKINILWVVLVGGLLALALF